MKVFELRAYLRERGVRGYSTMKKVDLEEKVKNLKEREKAETYEQNLRDTVRCAACLHEQRIKRKIDDKTFNRRLLEIAVRTLVCKYCKHANRARDGDDTICADCGTLQVPEAVAAV